MSIKRVVDTQFWEDATVIERYSVEDKYFLLYLMTNPHSAQVGIYKLPKKIISFETGYTVDSVSVILERFENKYKNVLYDNDTHEISVINSLKYSIVKGGKPVSDLLIKELNKIDSDFLVEKTYNHLLKFWDKSDRIFDETVKLIFEDELSKRKEPKETNDNDNDNDNDDSYHDSYHDSSNSPAKAEPPLPYKEIVDYLNQKAGTSYRASGKKTQSLIKARYNESFKLDDFKQVIDNKVAEWKTDNNMAKYLRPETLFGTKFESYLNQSKATKPQSYGGGQVADNLPW